MKRVRIKRRNTDMEREKVVHDAAYAKGVADANKEATKEKKALRKRQQAQKENFEFQIKELEKRLEAAKEELKKERKKKVKGGTGIDSEIWDMMIRKGGANGYGYKYWADDRT